MYRKFLIFSLAIAFIAVGVFSFGSLFNKSGGEGMSVSNPTVIVSNPNLPSSSVESPTPSELILKIPSQNKVLNNNYHIFQTFNNCGPASLSMALSYYEINESQQKIGNDLRPYQVAGGDNDDKSVTLYELAERSKEYGLVPYHRPNGNIDLIKMFVTYDMPVVARTWLKENDDIGHYRIIKGYDSSQIIQDDSLQGKNLKYSLSEFNAIWKKFNYEYLVLVPKGKENIAEKILGEDSNEKVAWEKAVKNAEEELSGNPNDVYARFNLSVALYNIGEYRKSVEEFEKVENELPFRTLWYQIEPIQAYFELGEYERVFSITDKILNNHNRAFSELYIIRGDIYLKQNRESSAKEEYEKAVLYNKNNKEAREKLESII